MEHHQLGRSGLRVSTVLLGGWNFGKVTTEKESHALLDRALDAGINVVDTADKYGRGTSETHLGNWLARSPQRRERMVVATKVFGAMSDWPNDGRLSARHLRHAVEGSLRRLRTDHIDLYQLHHVDRCTPWDEIWQAMDVLIGQGKVIYVGTSNHAGWQLAQGQEAALKRGGLGLVSEQCLYNLAERSAEQEVIPAALAYGMAVLPWSPLHGGMLAGVLSAGSAVGQRRHTGRGANSLTTRTQQVERFEQTCRHHGMAPAEVALAWLIAQPGVTAPIIGPRTLEQLESALRATRLVLPDSLEKNLEEIFPSSGPAPESFAW